MVTITISGKTKTGKSIMAQEIYCLLSQLGASAHIIGSSPNPMYVAKTKAHPIYTVLSGVTLK